jgi:ribokinase
LRILNFGSLNIDYVYSVNKFVVAGETISSTKLEKFCGGKGLNQSIALARAGCEVYHAGCIGEEGEILLNLLKKSGVKTDFITTLSNPNGHAIIQVDDNGQNCIILYSGTNKQITKEYVDNVLINFQNGDFLVLQNEINCLDYIINKAFDIGMIIVFNPSPINSDINNLPLEKIAYFILNEIEGEVLTHETEPQKIIERLKDKYPNSIVLLTRGKYGVICFDGKNTYTHGIYNVPVVDTTAAGDTFTGYFLACLVKYNDIKQALRLASIASSIAVSAKGAANSIPTINQVMLFKSN